jgi:imidazole glycerol-phosphate synthase subunit HisF
MLARRVIPCLDIRDGRVVKGVNFQNIRDAGDPVELARRYDAEGADELTFLDITASADKRKTLVELVRRVSEQLFIPFCVGGGIRTLDDMRAVLAAGADKVSVGTAAVREPGLIDRAAAEFGSQFIVVSLDVKRLVSGGAGPDGYVLTTHGGRQLTDIDAIAFAAQMADRGAGELLLNDMGADGTLRGFGLDLLQLVTAAVPISVIASGGAGTLQHFSDAVSIGGADAVLAASVFHDGRFSIAQVKAHMVECAIPVRPVRGGESAVSGVC